MDKQAGFLHPSVKPSSSGGQESVIMEGGMEKA